MADAIGPGDWVEAVRTKTHHFADATITKGSHYRCKEVMAHNIPNAFCAECHNDSVVLTLYEFPRRVGWCPCTFRPMRRDTDFSQLQTTTPKEVEPT